MLCKWKNMRKKLYLLKLYESAKKQIVNRKSKALSKIKDTNMF